MKFPDKLTIANLPTSLHALERLSKECGANLYIKRDDMTGGAETGNKIRKLEYVVAEVLRQGCDTVVTCGGADSNHCRATAIVCARLGLHCTLLLREPVNAFVGNLFLDRLLNADVRFCTADEYSSDFSAIRDDAMNSLRVAGRKPYWVPSGASMPFGALGYVECMAEIALYQKESGVEFDRIVFASGSGGTAAGLILGGRLHGVRAEITGINTGEDPGELTAITLEAGNGAAEILGVSERLTESDVILLNEYDAGGYALVTDEVLAVIRRLAKTEGIIVDPVYSGKAMMGLLGELENGHFQKGETILFIHTGGIYGLLSHYDLIQSSGK